VTLPSPFRAARSRLTVATEALTCAAMAGARSLPPAASAESSSRSRTVTSTHGVTAGGASSCVACSVLPEFQQELLTDRKFGSAGARLRGPGVRGQGSGGVWTVYPSPSLTSKRPSPAAEGMRLARLRLVSRFASLSSPQRLSLPARKDGYRAGIRHLVVAANTR